MIGQFIDVKDLDFISEWIKHGDFLKDASRQPG
jgi:hypothetical protein